MFGFMESRASLRVLPLKVWFRGFAFACHADAVRMICESLEATRATGKRMSPEEDVVPQHALFESVRCSRVLSALLNPAPVLMCLCCPHLVVIVCVQSSDDHQRRSSHV